MLVLLVCTLLLTGMVGSGCVYVDMYVAGQPTRHYIYREYDGYGTSYRYNLSDRNYLNKWFGDRHHHRDHHIPRRHTHDSHHYGGYRGYRY